MTGSPDLDRIGDYRLGDCLGEGHGGRVYAATSATGTAVALRVLAEPLDELRTREARHLRRPIHPSVAKLLDAGQDEATGTAYLVTELCSGPSLDAWVRAQARDWRAIVLHFISVGEGLATAHVRRLVHRNFKAANVLMDDQGRPRLVDFALPHMSADAPPAHIAPELVAGKFPTPESDQYAFATAALQALDGKTTPLTDGPPPPEIIDALIKGLATMPDKRWADLHGLVTTLRRYTEGEEQMVPPEEEPPSKRRLWLLLGLLGAAAAAAASAVLTGWV